MFFFFKIFLIILMTFKLIKKENKTFQTYLDNINFVDIKKIPNLLKNCLK